MAWGWFQAERDAEGTDISLTIVPTACRMKNQGYAFLVDGDPSLRSDLHLETGTPGLFVAATLLAVSGTASAV